MQEKTLNELIQTEAGCIQLLKEIRFPNGFECPTCFHTKSYRLKCRPVLECARCKSQVSVTSGTIFAGMRTPLTKLFYVIFKLASGESMQAADLGRKLQLVASTAWRHLQKLRMMIEEQFRLAETVLIDRVFLKNVLFRRSRDSQPATDQEESPTCLQEDDLDSEEQQAADDFCQHLRTVFRGISTKYCQAYASEYGIITGSRPTFRELLIACIRSGPKTTATIVAYSSSDTIALPMVPKFGARASPAS